MARNDDALECDRLKNTGERFGSLDLFSIAHAGRPADDRKFARGDSSEQLFADRLRLKQVGNLVNVKDSLLSGSGHLINDRPDQVCDLRIGLGVRIQRCDLKFDHRNALQTVRHVPGGNAAGNLLNNGILILARVINDNRLAKSTFS